LLGHDIAVLALAHRVWVDPVLDLTCVAQGC